MPSLQWAYEVNLKMSAMLSFCLFISLSKAAKWTSVNFHIETLRYTWLGEFNFDLHEPNLYQTALRHILEDNIIHGHRRYSLKSDVYM
jgi:hypothetical protein